MRMNARMSAYLGAAGTRWCEDDVPETFRKVVRAGWTTDGDAYILTALASGCHGTGHAGFQDVVHYEATVNGRGMTDYDLPAAGRARLDALLRRTLAYACAALRAVPGGGRWPMLGYVSLSEGGCDDTLLTAHVTFCSDRPHLPRHVSDLDAYRQEALLEISQADATAALGR